MLLEITIKNTSENVLDIREIISSFQVSDDLDMTGYSDEAEYYSSIEELTGEIGPGEVARI